MGNRNDSYMKNCEPFVSLPLLAIDSMYSLLCLTAKLSSGEKNKKFVLPS